MGGKRTRRVVAVQRCGDGWHVLQAEVVRDRVRVTSTGEAIPGHVANGCDVVLVSGSDRVVCRWLDLPEASAAQTRRMAALRLEAELPYPAARSAWGCDRQPRDPEALPRVLAIAAPSEDILADEAGLPASARPCDTVLSEAAALAELVADGNETCGLVYVRQAAATLVITRAGRLAYARRIVGPGSGSPAAQRVAQELNQCIGHYPLLADAAPPERLLTCGSGPLADDLFADLAQGFRLRVEPAAAPASVDFAEDVDARDAMARLAPCLGAVLWFRQRARGRPTAAPGLRCRAEAHAGGSRAGLAALVALDVALAVGLVVAGFASRRAQLRAADRATSDGRALVRQVERLEAEVAVLEHEARLRRPTLDTLKALAGALPKSLDVASIALDGRGKLDLGGTCASVEDVSGKAVSAMAASGHFANPRFLGATRDKARFKFRITCEARRPTKGAKR